MARGLRVLPGDPLERGVRGVFTGKDAAGLWQRCWRGPQPHGLSSSARYFGASASAFFINCSCSSLLSLGADARCGQELRLKGPPPIAPVGGDRCRSYTAASASSSPVTRPSTTKTSPLPATCRHPGLAYSGCCPANRASMAPVPAPLPLGRIRRAPIGRRPPRAVEARSC